jgi:saccharopine dehydrogenase-like NADP-dependent oxidoreductase
MRILLVGAGGVGSALARIAARRPFAELVIADYDLARAQQAAAARDGYEAVQLDARDERAVAGLLAQRGCDVLMNATDPRFVMPLFRAALSAGVHYLDMAMSLSRPDPDDPYRKTGVKLGDEQFALARQWEESGKLALVGIGVEPGLSDVFARYAADELLGEIGELGVRDGANLTVAGHDFAPAFSIWTTIEECLNPPVIWERGRGWFTTEPFSEPEVFAFPAGTGPDGAPREVYLYHVVDNTWSMAEYGSQAVVWQTAVNPVVALELIEVGAGSGSGVLGPEALPPRPFLDLLIVYGSSWAREERSPAGR